MYAQHLSFVLISMFLCTNDTVQWREHMLFLFAEYRRVVYSYFIS